MASTKELPIKERMIDRARRLREEALTTPFICLKESRRKSQRWKIRVLHQDYCGLLSYQNKKPTKCTYCLIHKPYSCAFKTKASYLLWEALFK